MIMLQWFDMNNEGKGGDCCVNDIVSLSNLHAL